MLSICLARVGPGAQIEAPIAVCPYPQLFGNALALGGCQAAVLLDVPGFSFPVISSDVAHSLHLRVSSRSPMMPAAAGFGHRSRALGARATAPARRHGGNADNPARRCYYS
jgi:hypothetical protein